jgi:hypothetical protein
MRPLIRGLLLFAVACTSIDSFTPTVTGLAATTGTNDRTPLALPFRICDVPTSFTDDQFRGRLPDPVTFSILGSGFMPEVANATSRGGDYRRPLVTLEGPTTYADSTAFVVDTGLLVSQLPFGDAPLVDGTYTVAVRNPDASEPVTARLANAVQIFPPPRATMTTSHVCLASAATVVFRGGPFVPGLRVLIDTSHPDLPVTIEAPDQVSVEVPALLNAASGTTLTLTFLDPTGCSSTAVVTAGCP